MNFYNYHHTSCYPSHKITFFLDKSYNSNPQLPIGSYFKLTWVLSSLNSSSNVPRIKSTNFPATLLSCSDTGPVTGGVAEGGPPRSGRGWRLGIGPMGLPLLGGLYGPVAIINGELFRGIFGGGRPPESLRKIHVHIYSILRKNLKNILSMSAKWWPNCENDKNKTTQIDRILKVWLKGVCTAKDFFVLSSSNYHFIKISRSTDQIRTAF